MRSFEKKFGREFLTEVPTRPGVYFVSDATGSVIYIGKAKNLRRRLAQYKNAKRRKRHAKMRAIVAEGASIRYEITRTDLEACLLETRLIQELRPKWNVAGAFFFLYPLIGLAHRDGLAHFVFTHEPENFDGFALYGAFRSRHITGDAFFAWMDLLEFVGHRVRGPARAGKSYVMRFRQIEPEFLLSWAAFFRGESREALENLALTLVEHAGARARAADVEEKLHQLRRFWRHEAVPLHRALGAAAHPVAQRDRDLLFLRYRHRERA